jgi:Prokaryotic E2 family E
MSFLPEDDRAYLSAKQISYEPKEEKLPDGTIRRGVVFPTFVLGANLYQVEATRLILCAVARVLIIIPKGYATTRLDSFYTSPRLKRADGTEPNRATGNETLFGEKWQFWSRHLTKGEWRPGIDGLETYLQYVTVELRRA